MMNLRPTTWLITSVLCLASPAWAIEADKVPESKKTPLGLYLTAQEASEMKAKKGAGVLFVDVRSKAEATFLGMAVSVDALIPYQDFNGETAPWDDKASSFGLEANLDFQKQIEAALNQRQMNKSSPLILMCRSGARSATAVSLLSKYGFSQVYTVVDGYEGDVAKDGPRAGQRALNGWRVEGLPWAYKLNKTKVGGL
jgi:rhodanese-related sulfurtransferase